MVDLRRLGMLHDDGDVGLAAAVDFAAGGGQLDAVGHLALDEVVVQLVHQRLDHTRSVGARDVAMQEALGVRNHGHRVGGAADRIALVVQRLDQRFDLGTISDHVFDVGTRGETHESITILVGKIGQFANGVVVHLTRRTGFDRPDFVAGFGAVIQNTRLGMAVERPLAVVLDHHGVHVGHRIRRSGFDRRTHFCHVLISN